MAIAGDETEIDWLISMQRLKRSKVEQKNFRGVADEAVHGSVHAQRSDLAVYFSKDLEHVSKLARDNYEGAGRLGVIESKIIKLYELGSEAGDLRMYLHVI